MSVAAINWAFEQAIKPATHKFVLVALSNFADSEGSVWPCILTLENMTGLNRKTIFEAMASLEESGLIADTGQRKGKTGQVKVYRIALQGRQDTTPKQYQERNSTEIGW